MGEVVPLPGVVLPERAPPKPSETAKWLREVADKLDLGMITSFAAVYIDDAGGGTIYDVDPADLPEAVLHAERMKRFLIEFYEDC